MSYVNNGGGTPWTDNIGFLNIPILSKSADYTTILSDGGKALFHPASDANARTFTIDSNANVAFPVWTVIYFINKSANNVTIAITDDTLYLDGAGTTWSLTLAQYGKATAIKETSTTWSIGGVGLTDPTPPVTYATWNPANKAASLTLSNGDLTSSDGSDGWSSCLGTLAKSSGKWYWEVTCVASSWNHHYWVTKDTTYNAASFIWENANGYAYAAAGNLYHNSVADATPDTFNVWDVIGIALDLDGGTLDFYKNNTHQGSQYYGLSGTFYPAFSTYQANDSLTANFWATAFTYTPPLWFNAWLYA